MYRLIYKGSVIEEGLLLFHAQNLRERYNLAYGGGVRIEREN